MTTNEGAWRKPRLTPVQWDEIVERYQAGETAISLAAEFGVSRKAVNARVSRRS